MPIQKTTFIFARPFIQKLIAHVANKDMTRADLQVDCKGLKNSWNVVGEATRQ